MALITIPASPEKGVAQQYSLNTTDLFALVSDDFFKDQNNLKVINLVYQSSVSNQLDQISFIPNGSVTLNAMSSISDKARDIFNVKSIVLLDKQNGRYIVSASEIPNVGNYQLDFTPPPSMQPFSTEYKFPATILSLNDYRSASTDTGGYMSLAYGKDSVTLESGKYYKEFTLTSKGLFASSNSSFGLRFFTAGPSDLTDSQNGNAGFTDNQYQIVMDGGVSASSYIGSGASTFVKIGATNWGVDISGDYSFFAPATGKVFGIALDADDPDKGLYISVDGVFASLANPSTKANKIALKNIFPGIPDSINVFAFFNMIGQNIVTINENPLYLPPGFSSF